MRGIGLRVADAVRASEDWSGKLGACLGVASHAHGTDKKWTRWDSNLFEPNSSLRTTKPLSHVAHVGSYQTRPDALRATSALAASTLLHAPLTTFTDDHHVYHRDRARPHTTRRYGWHHHRRYDAPRRREQGRRRAPEPADPEVHSERVGGPQGVPRACPCPSAAATLCSQPTQTHLPEIFASAYDANPDAKTTPVAIWGATLDPSGKPDARASVVLMKWLRARRVPSSSPRSARAQPPAHRRRNTHSPLGT